MSLQNFNQHEILLMISGDQPGLRQRGIEELARRARNAKFVETVLVLPTCRALDDEETATCDSARLSSSNLLDD